MNVLVTGTGGYIGSGLAPILQPAGHDVTGLDTGYYLDGWLYSNPRQLRSLPRGAEELYELFRRIDMSKDTYEFRAFTRLKQLRYLSKTGQIDESFYWR